MRSQLDGRYAGSGVTLAFVEPEETYQDIKVYGVRLPNDDPKKFAALSGPVVTYRLPVDVHE